jgi:hypothetical protein
MSLTDTKLQVLAEHYKNTFNFLQNNLKRRDRLFLGVLCILILILFQLYTPQEASNLISQFISNKLNITTQMNLFFVQSIIWFILLAITLKYFQSVIFIERQYNYIHKLEEQLSSEYGEKAFTREGSSYLKDYPIFLNWASFLYTIFFPVILLIISGSKIISECKTLGFKPILVWFNLAIFLFIVISVILYFIVLHFKRKKAT